MIKNNKPSDIMNANKSVQKKDITLQFKNDLQELYKHFEKYFAINSYYELIGKKNPDKLACILLSKVKEGYEVLEFGLNPGILTLEAAIKKAHATGIDASPMNVVIAESLKHIEHDKFSLIQNIDNWQIPVDRLLSCKFNVMNLSGLEFSDSHFDIIFSNGALENCEISSFLKEMTRCLKPNGEIILYFKISASLTLQIKKKYGEFFLKQLNYKTLQSWTNENNMNISYKQVKYKKGFGSFLIALFPFLQGHSLLAKYEDSLLIQMTKHPYLKPEK